MEWQFIVAMVVIIPVILLPVAFVWYLNLSGIYAAVREARMKRAAEKRLATEKVTGSGYRQEDTEDSGVRGALHRAPSLFHH